MKKIFSLFLLLCLSFSFTLFDSASAESNSISKDLNGLVKPLSNPEKLSINKLDERLNAIGFTEEEIEGMSDYIKREIVKSGGKKVEIETEAVEHYYTSLDGTRYKVTPENEKEIEKIKENDRILLNLVNREPTFGTMNFSGGDQDGKWSATTFVTKTGETSKEYEYKFYVDWEWDGSPNAYYTDTVAVSWQNEFTGLSRTENGYAWAVASYADGDRVITTTDQVLDMGIETYGLMSYIGLGTWKRQGGGISQKLAVNKNLDGTRTSLVTRYLHHWFPGKVSVNIGPGSIEPERFVGDDWSYRVNVTIGN